MKIDQRLKLDHITTNSRVCLGQPTTKIDSLHGPSVEHQHWMAQWRAAGVALQKLKEEELASMSVEKAQLATQRVLSFPYHMNRQSPRWTYSGLVEQQKYFMKATSKK